MKFEIVERNCQAGERLRGVFMQKLEKLDKYFEDGDTDCKVYFKKENNTQRSEIMLDYHGHLVRATEQSDNFYDNIDRIMPKLEGQIRKYRTRFDKQQKNGAFKEKMIYDSGEERQPAEAKIVKEKSLKLQPMLLEEALAEMEMLGHSFFIFFDFKTQSVRVLYKRSDGDLGLIDTEV